MPLYYILKIFLIYPVRTMPFLFLLSFFFTGTIRTKEKHVSYKRSGEKVAVRIVANLFNLFLLTWFLLAKQNNVCVSFYFDTFVQVEYHKTSRVNLLVIYPLYFIYVSNIHIIYRVIFFVPIKKYPT